MRKVKLQVEQLAVETFETSASWGQGTVFGRMPNIVNRLEDAAVNGQYPGAGTYPECPSPLCMDTPLASCDGSCKPGCVAVETGAVVEG
jgi:hypothetical protein